MPTRATAARNREDHARWAERYLKLQRETETLRRRIDQRTNTIARQFDRVCEVLEELEYLDGDKVTPAGASLSRLYSELDLVAAECLRRGTWDGLGGTGARRGAVGTGVRVPQPDDAERAASARRRRAQDARARWSRSGAELDAVERDHRVSFLREPDLGFAWAAYRWAGGATSTTCWTTSTWLPVTSSGGSSRSSTWPTRSRSRPADPACAGPSREAVRAMRRGVVAYSAEIDYPTLPRLGQCRLEWSQMSARVAQMYGRTRTYGARHQWRRTA